MRQEGHHKFKTIMSYIMSSRQFNVVEVWDGWVQWGKEKDEKEEGRKRNREGKEGKKKEGRLFQ